MDERLAAIRRWFQGPRGPFRSASTLLALLLAIVAIHENYEARPKPRELDWSIEAPGATPLVDGARPETLRVTFTDSAVRLEDAGKPVKRGAIGVMPRVRGDWSWAGERELRFTPSEDWPAGTEYTVRLDRSMFPKHLRPAKTADAFTTAGFTASLASSEFHVDPANPKIKRVAATFKFSHPVDAESFEKRLSMTLVSPKKTIFDSGRAAKKFEVKYDKFQGEAYVVSEPLEIPLEASQLELVAGAGARPVRGSGTSGDMSASVRVPSMFDYFRLEGADTALVRNERLEPEQILVITASAGVGEKELAGAIQAWALPEWRAAGPGRPQVSRHGWYSPVDVDSNTLAASSPVALTPIPADREHPTRHAFKLRAPPEKPIYLRVKRGLAAYGGYVLAADFDAVVRPPAYPREIKILHEGSILRLSGERKLSLYSLGERHVRLEAGRVRPNQINHLASQTGGSFSNPSFRNWGFGADNITERFEEFRPLENVVDDRLKFFSFDFTPHLQAPGSGTRNGLFFLRAEGWDPVHHRPTGSADARFVLITDLGVLLKENADKTRDVFVQSLGNGEPVAGARVEVLGLNGLPVASAETGESGRARLPDLTGFTRERRPAVVVVRHGEDLSFLPFDRDDRRLDVSRFDVGGETTEGREDELSAFVFSDRGLYRPGETFHAGILVRPKVWGRDLAGIPLEAAVLDPRGLEIKRYKLSLGAAAFESVSYATQENGPTGSYQICVYLVRDGRRHSLLGSTSVRVEEFQPDRLKISARFSAERDEGWIAPEGLKALVSLRNLFGSPAEARRVTASLRLSPGIPYFRRWAGWNFHDPNEATKSFAEGLEEVKTDAEGAATIPVPLDRFAGGTYRVEVAVEGFEAEGGRGVAAQIATVVSPRAFVVGVKPDGELRWVNKGSSRTVSAVAVGPDGTPVEAKGLSSNLIEERWVSALIKGNDGLYRYQSVKKELFVSSRAVSLPAEPRAFKLDADSPGDYSLILRDGAGAELARVRYNVIGHGNIARSLEKNAELQLRLEKPDYAPGETALLHLRAPYAGAGLITVERDKTYAHKWFRATTASSTQTIRVPEALEGNGYVTVTYLRAPDSREIFMSPLSHGVAPFSVSRSRRELDVKLTAPEAMKPGRDCVVRVSVPRRARVAVFAADEGILQAAGWRAPEPLAHFLRKRALEVRTFQILDLLLPEYRLSLSVMAPGGDASAWEAIGRNLNPFKRRRDKPAVFWSGLIDVGPEGREIRIPVPDTFNGSLKITAVAAEPASIGVVQAKTLVREALVLTANAPLFVAPGDEFETSVSVANGVKGSGPKASIRVALKASGHLEFAGPAFKDLEVGENREGVAVFRLRAKPALGAAELGFEAALSSETSRRAVSLSVRPSMPYQIVIKTGHHKKGREDVSTPRRMYPSYRVLEASASPVPLVLAKGLLEYLRMYPYGCTEQVLSQAFPALILRGRPEFGYAPEKVETNLARAIDILRSRQNEDGAFGMWAANSHSSPFHAVYAAHFLTEAKEKGYAIPPDLLARDLGYLERLAGGIPGEDAPARVRAYAIYVLTRNGKITTPLINALRARLDADGDGWKTDLTGAYLASSYAMLHLDAQASELIRAALRRGSIVPDWLWFYDDTVHESQLMYLLARHFPERLNDLDADSVLRIVEPLARGSYNSLSSANMIMALDAYVAAAGELKPGEERLSELREGGGTRALVLPPGLFAKVEYEPAARAIRYENNAGRRVFHQTTQSGYELKTPTAPVSSRMEVFREMLDEKGKPVTEAELGREYDVRLRLRALDGGWIPHVAVVDLVPGGFEPVWKDPRGDTGGREAAEHCRQAYEGGDSDGDEESGGREPGACEPIATDPASSGDWRELREDRALFFTSAHASVAEHLYRVKASSRGRFVVPPPFAESMYDRTASALGAASTIEVK